MDQTEGLRKPRGCNPCARRTPHPRFTRVTAPHRTCQFHTVHSSKHSTHMGWGGGGGRTGEARVWACESKASMRVPLLLPSTSPPWKGTHVGEARDEHATQSNGSDHPLRPEGHSDDVGVTHLLGRANGQNPKSKAQRSRTNSSKPGQRTVAASPVTRGLVRRLLCRRKYYSSCYTPTDVTSNCHSRFEGGFRGGR